MFIYVVTWPKAPCQLQEARKHFPDLYNIFLQLGLYGWPPSHVEKVKLRKGMCPPWGQELVNGTWGPDLSHPIFLLLGHMTVFSTERTKVVIDFLL